MMSGRTTVVCLDKNQVDCWTSASGRMEEVAGRGKIFPRPNKHKYLGEAPEDESLKNVQATMKRENCRRYTQKTLLTTPTATDELQKMAKDTPILLLWEANCSHEEGMTTDIKTQIETRTFTASNWPCTLEPRPKTTERREATGAALLLLSLRR